MKVVKVFGASLVALNAAAFLVEMMWPPRYTDQSFFWLEIYRFDYMPYWLLANLLLVAINGLALVHNSSVRARRDALGGISGVLPFTSSIVLGYNLVAIPVLILIPRFWSLLPRGRHYY